MEVNIIFGAPGTGKTTELLNILEQELHNGYKLNEIAYVSYTREGSYQGKNRAKKIYKEAKEEDFAYFRTLHSLAFNQLEFSRPMVIGKKAYKEFSEKMGMHFTGYYTEDLKHNDDKYLFIYDLHRNNPKMVKNYVNDLDIKTYQIVKDNFKRFKEHYRIFDYTDMIRLFVNRNQAIPVKIAIIDEAQDLTSLQWLMVWTAFKDCEKIYIAGDDDQSIYQWSGADVEYFLNLQGNIRILNKSHRLPYRVLNLSKEIVKLIDKRVEKNIESTGKEGKVEFIHKLEELEIKPHESWLFLSRNHWFISKITEFLNQKGLPYKFFDKQTIQEKEISLIKLYEHVRSYPVSFNELGLEQVTRLTSVMIDKGKYDSPWYDNFIWEVDKINHYRDFIKNRYKIDDYSIRVSTIHTTKGSEADNVVVLTDITKTVYKNLQENPDSEHRVFYVAVTRARCNLFIVDSSSEFEYKIERKKT